MKRKILSSFIAIAVLSVFFTGCQKTPEASFIISNSEPNVNEEVVFTNLSVEGNTYEWNFGDGKTSEEFSPSHSYSKTGNYTVKLTAYSKNGKKSDEYTRQLTVISTDLQITVYLDGTEYIITGCPVDLYTSSDDFWSSENVVASGKTNDEGKVLFVGLKTIEYYIDAYGSMDGVFYANWDTGIKTKVLTKNEVNKYNVYIAPIEKSYNGKKTDYQIIKIVKDF